MARDGRTILRSDDGPGDRGLLRPVDGQARLPHRGSVASVLIAGAGPSGAIAALVLARAGVAVTLVEKSAWPRPKTCGDGISPHAIRDGAALGLHLEGRVHLERARVSTPRETVFTSRWPAEIPWGTTIERREFDASLVAAAVAAGAHFVPATAVASVAMQRKRVVARLRSGEHERSIEADAIVVAEGATGGLARALGFPPHRSRLLALRGYAEAPVPLEATYGLFYDRALSPGYGWVFPVDARRANVGICIDEKTLARRGGNLRTAFAAWLRESRFARELLGHEPDVRDLRGGVIPSGRRVRAKGRAFLVGDAAGVADPFTAEGIFQAMRSGELAARALLGGGGIARARQRYERELAFFDRNERAARGLRATFGLAIEPFARRAVRDAAFATYLNTAVFLPKAGFVDFVWRLLRA